MTTLFAFLVGAVGPLAIRVLMAIGFATVTFTGVTVAMNNLIEFAQTNWSSLPATVLQLASIAGIPLALGMVFGAGMARVTLWMVANSTKLIFKGV
jgi:hypothetical protein